MCENNLPIRKHLFLSWVCCLLMLFSAQEVLGQETALDLGYFSVMVIPAVQEGEKISTKLAADPDLRNTVTLFEAALLKLNLQVYNFNTRYDQYLLTANLKEHTTDSKGDFLAYASPDIHCEIVIEDISCDNSNHKARISALIYLTSSGRLLSTWTDDSNCFNNAADFLSLLKRVVNKVNADFTTQIKSGLNSMTKLGQPIELSFTIDESAAFSFNSDVRWQYNGYEEVDNLAGLISFWFEEQEDVLYFKPIGQTDYLLRYDDVRLPLIDEKSNRIYSINRFTNRLTNRFLNRLILVTDDDTATISLKASTVRVNGLTVIQISAK